MKAVAIQEHGAPDVLKYLDLPDPQIAQDEVLVRLKASALNRMDLFARVGWKGLNLSFPHVLGADGAGIAEEVGDRVVGVRAGEEVVINPGLNCGECELCQRGEDSLCVNYSILGEQRDGTYAELVKVPARNILPKPKGRPFEEVAAVPLVYMTAWRMLVERARVQPDETVLVLGAGGGVASAAIQIAKVLGAKVFATSSSGEKLKKARDLGADLLINYKEEPFERVAWEATGKRGVDVVIESVGESTWKQSLRSLANNGRLVTCGATTGPKGDTDIRVIFWKQLQILGSTMGTRAGLQEVLNLVSSGKLRAPVHRVFPLERARDAHEVLEQGKQFGKVVLRP